MIIISEKPGLDLMKQMYFQEIQVKEMLNSRIQVPFTILSVLIAVLTYMKANLPKDPEGIIFDVFLFGCLTSSQLIVVTLWYLCKAMFSRDIAYLPTPKQIDDYIKSVEAYHKELNSFIPLDRYVKEELDNMIYEHIVEKCSNNFNQNVDRIKSIQLSNTYVIHALFFTVLGFLAFLLI